jgi:hypothetical protein
MIGSRSKRRKKVPKLIFLGDVFKTKKQCNLVSTLFILLPPFHQARMNGGRSLPIWKVNEYLHVFDYILSDCFC